MSKLLPELYLIVGQESLLFPVGSWAGEAEISCGSKYRLVSQLEIDVLGAVCSRPWLCVFQTSVGVSMGVHLSPVLRAFTIPGQHWLSISWSPASNFTRLHILRTPKSRQTGYRCGILSSTQTSSMFMRIWAVVMSVCDILWISQLEKNMWRRPIHSFYSLVWSLKYFIENYCGRNDGTCLPACSPSTRVVETGSEVQG